MAAEGLQERAASEQPGESTESPSFSGDVEKETTYEDGSSYKGQLLEGKRHGCGAWISSNGSYDGQWRNDHRDGRGRQVWQDEHGRRVYEGQYKDGNFDGHGRMEWHTPSGICVYEGQYAKDRKHGAGRFTWPDGRVYDGQFRFGQRCGKAEFSNAGRRRVSCWREDRWERWIGEGTESEGGDAGADGQG